MENVILKLNDVGIKFNMSSEKVDNLKEFFIKFLKKELMYNEFWALRHVSFEMKRGDRIGIMGLNGAGKSTLMKLVAGVYKPSEGTIYRKGSIAPLIELGAGFDMNYTGAENIFLYGTILGYTRSFLNEKFDEIVEFADLGTFINVPVKNYSSGMRARLGFAIATVVEPDILILDEVLSVGDAKFRKKCENRMQELFEKGVAVLFVSHSFDQIYRLCNKALLLDHGQMMMFDTVENVGKTYDFITG